MHLPHLQPGLDTMNDPPVKYVCFRFRSKGMTTMSQDLDQMVKSRPTSPIKNEGRKPQSPTENEQKMKQQETEALETTLKKAMRQNPPTVQKVWTVEETGVHKIKHGTSQMMMLGSHCNTFPVRYDLGQLSFSAIFSRC